MYEEFVAEYYDHLPVTSGRADAEFYGKAAREQGDPILELGCGTGRILLPLAHQGHRMVGLDLSAAMLARARAKLEKEPAQVRERVQLVEADMTDFDLGETFRLAIIPFRPFQHLLTVEAQRSCLRCVQCHLGNGGRLILDFFQTDPRRMHDPAFHEERRMFPEFSLPDGRRVTLSERTVAFHRAEQRNDVEMIFHVQHPDGRRERLVHAFTLRYFFRYEVEHLLALGGFRVLQVFGGFDESPLRDDSPEMIFVAEKVSGGKEPLARQRCSLK